MMDLKSSIDSQAHHGFVGDVQQLQSLKIGKDADTQEGLKKVAQEFESMYLKMMLDAMRKAEKVWAKDNPFGSREQDMFRDMLDGQLSKELSTQGSLGLADMLVRQLSGHVSSDSTQESEPNLPHPNLPRPNLPHARLSQKNSSVDFAGQPTQFVDIMMPYAIKAGQQLGVDPKLLIAQAALETGWGKSLKRDQHGYNMFGIKAGVSWDGNAQEHPTTEVYDGQTLRQKASFRSYDSIQNSFDDYVNLVKSRYASAHAEASNPRRYVEQLSAHGYATDPLYAEKVLSIYSSDISSAL